jgi:hypothetical protein
MINSSTVIFESSTAMPPKGQNLTLNRVSGHKDPELCPGGQKSSDGPRKRDQLQLGVSHIAGGAGLYSQFRWGDFSAVAPDNSSPSNVLMWTAGDYDNSGNWGTAISAQSFINPKDQ